MRLIRIKEKFQVTIPEEVRRKLDLKVGDYLEVEVQGSVILLRPKALRDKDAAWERLQGVLERLRQRTSAPSDEEVEREVLAALRDVRSGAAG